MPRKKATQTATIVGNLMKKGESLDELAKKIPSNWFPTKEQILVCFASKNEQQIAFMLWLYQNMKERQKKLFPQEVDCLEQQVNKLYGIR